MRNQNLTIRKLASFAINNAIGAAVFIALQYACVEWLKTHYLVAAVAAGGVSMLIKFVLLGVYTYAK